MKKITTTLMALFFVIMTTPIYAQNEVPVGGASGENTDDLPDWAQPWLFPNTPPLRNGVAGQGTIEDPYEYWAVNGYPDNISFAHTGGGEIQPDGTISIYCLIGIVEADEADKQGIINLLSPGLLVTFIDCTYSYKQREAAFNEISANTGEVILSVTLLRGSEAILVRTAEGYEREYAQKFLQQYGSFVAISNGWITETYTSPQTIDSALVSPDSFAGTGQSVQPVNADTRAALGPEVIVAPGIDKAINGTPDNTFDSWLVLLGMVFLVGAVTIVFFNRARLIPAMQTNGGNVVAGNTPISRKQTLAVIKSSALTPSSDISDSIMESVNLAKRDTEQQQRSDAAYDYE